jgi:adenylate cyclase
VLAGQQLTNPVTADVREWVAAVLGGLAIIIVLPWIGARWTFLLLLIDITGLTGYCWFQFTRNFTLYDPSFPVATAFLIFVLMTYASYTREENRKRQVKGAFGRYLAPDMIDLLVSNPDRLRLGGEKRDMTMMFCDVRGFTAISELYDAVQLTQLINRFLTPMSEAILSHKGTIDKFMGDCVMAFWNAPLNDPDHAANACRAALEMQKRLPPLNAKLAEEAAAEGREFLPIKIGIGINSGDVVVGNMGSEQRFDYSVLGDNVNLASRLEGQSKTYGVVVAVGENAQALAPQFAMLELDLIQVKGKSQAVRIFSLIGDEAVAANPDFQALKVEHDRMLAFYRAQDWVNARSQIDRCHMAMRQFNLAGVYILYSGRLRDFERSPPPKDWNGVYVAESK